MADEAVAGLGDELDDAEREWLARDTVASISAGFGPEPLRFLYYQPALRMLAVTGAVLILAIGGLIAGGAAASGPGWWPGWPAAGLYFLALLLGPVLFFTLMFLGMAYGPMARHLREGLLVPGVAVADRPLAVVVLASLKNGRGPGHHGLVRIEPGKLPATSHEPGTRLPLAANFYQGKDMDRWLSFVPEPIAWGTGRPDRLARCLGLIGEVDFRRLERLIARGIVPATTDEMILLDQHDRKLETLSIVEEKKRAVSTDGTAYPG